MNQIQLTSQTPSHVEITKISSTKVSLEVELLTASAKKQKKQKNKNKSVSGVDWCKVHVRLAISFEKKLARLSSKTNNIHDKKHEVFRYGFIR